MAISYDPAIGYEDLTVADTAVGVAFENVADAEVMWATLDDAEIRFRYDGGDPTTTSGHLMTTADQLRIVGPTNIAAFRAIRTGAVSGVLRITYER